MARNMPSYLDAEQSVLGAIFLEPKKILVVKDRLNDEDFYDQSNMLIYSAMKSLIDQELKIDYTSVAAELEKAQVLTKIGGLDYLIELADFVATTSHLETYIDLVKDASLKRQLIEAASKIIEEGYSRDVDAKEYLDKTEEIIFALTQKRKTGEFAKMSDVIQLVKEKTESNRSSKGGVTGLQTGFSNLDSITAGLQPEELIILAARPSIGKSAFAMNLALNVAKRNKNATAGVAIFSLEMGNDQLAARMLSAEANIESTKIKTGSLSSKDWLSLEVGTEALSKLNIFFDDSAAVSVNDIRAKCRKLKQEDKLDFVIIDYLQLIKEDSRSGNRQEEVARISRSLKQMARELKIPVLALSQLSRDVEKREDKKPVLADLRESGSIEQDADIVTFLYRDEYYTRSQSSVPGEAELIIAKNRQGIAGVSIYFFFETEYSRFRAKMDQDENN